MTSMINVCGIISSENGGLNTVAPWIQASTLDIPIVDATCDGRAHPTSIMESLGLHKLENYTTIQSFSSTPSTPTHICSVIKGSLQATSNIIRL